MLCLKFYKNIKHFHFIQLFVTFSDVCIDLSIIFLNKPLTRLFHHTHHHREDIFKPKQGLQSQKAVYQTPKNNRQFCDNRSNSNNTTVNNSNNTTVTFGQELHCIIKNSPEIIICKTFIFGLIFLYYGDLFGRTNIFIANNIVSLYLFWLTNNYFGNLCFFKTLLWKPDLRKKNKEVNENSLYM